MDLNFTICSTRSQPGELLKIDAFYDIKLIDFCLSYLSVMSVGKLKNSFSWRTFEVFVLFMVSSQLYVY